MGLTCGVGGILDPHGPVSAQSLLLSLQILEAFAADNSAFVHNYRRLMAMNSAIMTMSHYEFCKIFNTKLESIGQRITCYQPVPAPCGALPQLLGVGSHLGCFCYRYHSPVQLCLNKWEIL